MDIRLSDDELHDNQYRQVGGIITRLGWLREKDN